MIKKYKYLKELIDRYPNLEVCQNDIIAAYLLIEDCYSNKGILLVAGNGGSASDALHIVGELMKGFILSRPVNKNILNKLNQQSPHFEYLKENLQMPLSAIALVSEIALTTAYSNDVAPDLIFAQQVLGYAKKENVFLGISTSGNSKNIIYAAEVAKSLNIKVGGLSGGTGGEMAYISDVCIKVPEIETFKIQELHLPIYHAICLELENKFFGMQQF